MKLPLGASIGKVARMKLTPIALFAFAGLLAACSDDNMGGPDAPPGAVNGCTAFMDRTASNMLNISFGGGSGNNYVDKCAKVKVGTAITFMGDFTMHPLQAHNGDSPNPFPTSAHNTGTSFVVTPSATGTFGFWCTVHGSIGMQGAIQVVP